MNEAELIKALNEINNKNFVLIEQQGKELSRRNEVINRLGDELQTYRELEEQGLLIKLPCKAGDAVFEANILRNIISVYKITSVIIMTGSRNYGWELQDGIYSNLNGFNEYAIGRSVFLTREAAEQALKANNEPIIHIQV